MIGNDSCMAHIYVYIYIYTAQNTVKIDNYYNTNASNLIKVILPKLQK